MSKLIMGDIHTKAEELLPGIDKIIDRYKVEEVYFLGDYIDEWGATEEAKIWDLEELIKWDKKSKTKNTFLCGNHDLAYVFPIFPCSGHSFDIEDQAGHLLREELNVQFSTIIDDYLLTHAGVRDQWYLYFIDKLKMSKDASYIDISDKMNKIFNDMKKEVKSSSMRDILKNINYESPILLLGMCGSSRGGRDHFSGPVWCDKYELSYDPAHFNQIVGHTPVRTCTNEAVDDDHEIWFCDTHSLYSDYENFGDNSVLLYDDDKLFKKIKLF